MQGDAPAALWPSLQCGAQAMPGGRKRHYAGVSTFAQRAQMSLFAGWVNYIEQAPMWCCLCALCAVRAQERR